MKHFVWNIKYVTGNEMLLISLKIELKSQGLNLLIIYTIHADS